MLEIKKKKKKRNNDDTCNESIQNVCVDMNSHRYNHTIHLLFTKF